MYKPNGGFSFLPFGENVFGEWEAMLEALRTYETGFVKEFENKRRGFLPPEIILVANTRHTVIRVGKCEGSGKKLTPEAKWEWVKKVFPLGRAVNENSHVFDGCIYSAKNESCFFMAALPLGLSDAITRFGVALVGSEQRLARLETLENFLFSRFCAQDNKAERLWITFPQDGGLRVLVISQGLPQAAHFLPTLPHIREGALNRVYQADTPEKVIVLTRDDWAAFWDKNNHWFADALNKNGGVTEFAKF